MSQDSHARSQDLDSAIRRVIASWDSFDRPVPVAALAGIFGRPEETVRAVLDGLRNQGAVEVEEEAGLCFWPGKRWSVRRWEKDQAYFRSQLPELRQAAARLARVPFVRGVLLVGEASVGCLRPGEGYEFFVIARKERVWLCRRLARRLARGQGRNGLAWLESAQFMSDGTLTLPMRNENTALEFAFGRVLVNPEACGKFLEANRWMRAWYQPLPTEDPGAVCIRGQWLKSLRELLWNLVWNPKWEKRLLRRRSAEVEAMEPEARRSFGKHASPAYARQELPRFQGGWLSRLHSTPRAQRSGLRTRLALLKGIDAQWSPRLLVTHARNLEASDTPCEPVELLAAAAFWKRAGIPVKVYDASFEADARGFARVLQNETPSLALIYATRRTRTRAIALIRECRSLRNPVLVCGPDAPAAAAVYCDAGADGVVAGDPEPTVLDVVRAIGSSGAAVHEIAGWCPNGEPGAWRPYQPNLEPRPAPDREAVDLRPYLQAWKARHGFSCLHVLAAHGCPRACEWCPRDSWEAAARLRPAGAVAEEMRRLQAEQGAERVWLLDDLPLAHPAWVEEFCRELANQRPLVAFECMLHPANADPQVLRQLREAGCVGLWMDAGSASARILNRLRRAATLEQVRAAAGMVREAGIPLGVHLQIGVPGEQPKDIEATRRFLQEIRPDHCDLAWYEDFVHDDAPYRRAYAAARAGESYGPPPWRLRLLQRIALRYLPLDYRCSLRQVHGRVRRWKLRLLQAAFWLAAKAAPNGREPGTAAETRTSSGKHS